MLSKNLVLVSQGVFSGGGVAGLLGGTEQKKGGITAEYGQQLAPLQFLPVPSFPFPFLLIPFPCCTAYIQKTTFIIIY